MKRTLIIAACIAGVLVGLGFVFPALAQMKNLGSLPNLSVALLLLGLLLTVSGGGAAFYGVRQRA
jgi:uncharacterized membrane protein